MSLSKKIIPLILLGVSAVFFFIYDPFAWFSQSQPQLQTEVMEEAQELAQAIESGKSLHCTMTDKDGSVVEYDVKDQKTKVTGKNISQNNKMGYMINDGEWVYIWEEGATEGMKNRIPTQEEIEETTQEMEKISYEIPDFSNEESMDNYENDGYTIDCNPVNLGDSDFTPPTDVNFIDFAEQMKNSFSEMEVNLDEMELPAEIESMM